MRDRTTKYLLLLPASVVILGTTLWPLGAALLASFRDWRLKRAPLPGRFVGLDNYLFAFEEPDFLNAIAVTARFVVLDVALTLILALGLALLLRRAGLLQSLTRAVLIIPFAMSPALIGVSFRFMFNGEHGVLAKGLGALIPWLSDLIWLAHPWAALLVLVLSDVWHWFPYMTLVILGGLAAIPAEAEEAARIDGASEAQVLRHVVLPQLRGVLAVVGVLKTIFALKMFDQVVTLTGGGPGISTQTLAHYVFTVGFVHYDMGLASALAWMLTLVLAAVGIVYLRMILPARGPGHG
jgi:multiple sugar transport system permease protein